MRLIKPAKAVCATLLVAVAGSALGQEIALDDKRFRINRIDRPPIIDGRIGDTEWQDAARISDLHEVEPVEFTAPSERTVWYFAYDDKALYVAKTCPSARKTAAPTMPFSALRARRVSVAELMASNSSDCRSR